MTLITKHSLVYKALVEIMLFQSAGTLLSFHKGKIIILLLWHLADKKQVLHLERATGKNRWRRIIFA